MDRIEFVCFRQSGRHVREGPVELTGGVGGGVPSPPGPRYRADIPQSLGVGGGSSDVSPCLLETFL